MKADKTVGILGGMGPEATADLLSRIIRLTPANDDEDHIRCLIDNNPKVPSRIKAIIEGTGEDPAPCLREMARQLEAWGADFLAMPCNTAHYYLADIISAVSIPVLDIVAITLEAVRQSLSGLSGSKKLVGLMASPALRIIGLYEEKTRAIGAEILYPSDADQELLLKLIKAVKAGQNTEEMSAGLASIAANLTEQGAAAIVIACTELGVIPLRFSKAPVFDASEELAKEIVSKAKA